MVEFLNTSKAYAEIEDIIDKADSKVVLISPYIRFPQPLLERLKYKDSLGIKTVVVCRENDSGKNLGDKVKSDLKQLKYLELRFDDDLHAKCFYNEKSMVITSLNLLESSERKNREMGVLLSLTEDAEVFKEALSEAEFIVNRAKKDSLIGSLFRGIVRETKSAMNSTTEDIVEKTKTSRRIKATSRTKREGHCIRCGESIPYNEKKLYCKDCYTTSYIPTSRYAREQRCHYCGGKAETSQAKPLCTKCYALLYL